MRVKWWRRNARAHDCQSINKLVFFSPFIFKSGLCHAVMTVTVSFVLWSRSIGLLLGQDKGLDSPENKLLVFPLLFKLLLSWNLLAIEDDFFYVFVCVGVRISGTDKIPIYLYIVQEHLSWIWLVFMLIFLVYFWGAATISSNDCPSAWQINRQLMKIPFNKEGVVCSLGSSYCNHNSNNTNKLLLQHRSSQMCFYWSRILNFQSGKHIFHISFIWKAWVERDYIRNHPFCHDTDFYFPLGPFKICVLQSVSKTNSGQDLLHTDEL